MISLPFKVGDRLELIRDVTPHGVVGDIFTVVRLVDSRTAIMDRCGCSSFDGHRSNMSWGVGPDYFINIGPALTKEEIDRAKPLPSADDVASFLGIKP